MSKPVYSDGRLHVMPDKCSTCIFRPGNLMGLEAGRVKDMVVGATGNDSVIPCHKTIHGQREQEAICRGYYDSYGSRVAGIRLAIVMGVVTEVDPA